MPKSNKPIFFIHGWLSSPTGEKAQLFFEKLKAQPLSYRDCEPHEIDVDECITKLKHQLRGNNNITLIGSILVD